MFESHTELNYASESWNVLRGQFVHTTLLGRSSLKTFEARKILRRHVRVRGTDMHEVDLLVHGRQHFAKLLNVFHIEAILVADAQRETIVGRIIIVNQRKVRGHAIQYRDISQLLALRQVITPCSFFEQFSVFHGVERNVLPWPVCNYCV